MSVRFQLRMYTVKLLHLQLAVLDGFIVSRKKQWKISQSRLAHLLFMIILVHIFPLVYSYFFVLKSVQCYVWAF